MNRTSRLSAVCISASFAILGTAAAQDNANQKQTTTQQTETTQQTTQVSTINGKVVRYEPGKTIVVLGPDNKEVTYTLSTTANIPAEVQVGRVVSLSTEPSPNGPVVVTRVTMQSMTPDGQMKTETQTHSTDMNGNQSMTKTTSVTGTVSAFEPGKSVTFTLPDNTTAVYTVDASSLFPSDVAVGRTYTIQTAHTSANGPVVVKTITTTTTKKTTKP